MLTTSNPNLLLTPFNPPQYFHIYHYITFLFLRLISTICMHIDVRLSTHWNLSNLLAVNSQEK